MPWDVISGCQVKCLGLSEEQRQCFTSCLHRLKESIVQCVALQPACPFCLAVNANIGSQYMTTAAADNGACSTSPAQYKYIVVALCVPSPLPPCARQNPRYWHAAHESTFFFFEANPEQALLARCALAERITRAGGATGPCSQIASF